MQWGGSTTYQNEQVRPKVGKDRVCICVVWQDGMKMGCCTSTPGSLEYILRVADSTSVTPVSPYNHRRSWTVYLEAVIKLIGRYTWRPRSSELQAALWGHDQAGLEMHLEAEIEWTERCTMRSWSCEFGDAIGDQEWVNSRCPWRPWSSEFQDALCGRDRGSVGMQLHTEIKCTEGYTPRQWSSQFGDGIGDRDWVNSEMCREAVIERVWRCSCRLWSSEIGGLHGGSRFGGRRDGSWDSIHSLTCNCGNVESWEQQHPPRDEKLAGSGRLSLLGWCCTLGMLYRVCAVLCVNSWLWHGEMDRDDLTLCSQVMVELSTRKRERSQEMGEIIMRNWDWREFCVQVDWPSPRQQVHVPMRRVITPIRGLVHSIRQVILPIFHSPSYPPYCAHPHPSSLSVLSTTLPSSQEHKVKSSHSISACHHHEFTLSAAYTEYNIHWVQHTPNIVCRPFILTMSHWPLNVASASSVPPYQSTATSQFAIRASKVKSARHIDTVSS